MKKKYAIKKVKKLLVGTIQNSLKGVNEVALPFSGSLDSSLVAFIVKNYTNCKFKLYTIGFPNCYDFKQSTISYRLLLPKHKPKQILLRNDLVEQNLIEYLKLTSDKHKVSISFTLPFYILLKFIPEKYVITSHGADTLFGGFHKYLKVKSTKLKVKIRQTYDEFLKNLDTREFKIAEYFDKKLIMPFTDEKLQEFVLSQPAEFFIKDNIRKYGLRKVAEEVGLPKEITILPKKSFQYSSGIIKPLKKIWHDYN